jgi:hypothetical protein
VDYPGSQGTVATSVSSTHTIAGYVIDPNGLSGISAFVQINGLPTLLDDPNEGGGSDAVTEILAISDDGAAVGFYTNAKGVEVPFDLNISQGTFTDLKPPGAKSAQATGITVKGNVTGIETTKSGIVGFYLHDGTYYPIARANAKVTEALGINRQDQVVGYYQGATGKTHGFVLTYPSNGGDKQVWQTVDDPKALDTTVVTGINDHDAICGWYKDAAGEIHGFVATPK